MVGSLVPDRPHYGLLKSLEQPVSLHVVYMATLPVRIDCRYEVPLRYAEADLCEKAVSEKAVAEKTVSLEHRLSEIPALLLGMQEVLEESYRLVQRASLLVLFEPILAEMVPAIRYGNREEVESATLSEMERLKARIFRHYGRYRTCSIHRERLLGIAHVVEHEGFREQLLLWIAPPGIHRTLNLHEWCHYLLREPIRS